VFCLWFNSHTVKRKTSKKKSIDTLTLFLPLLRKKRRSMRKVAIALIFFIVTTITSARPVIHFPVMAHDYGTLQIENGGVWTEFRFTNTGDAPLQISAVNTSCGCTEAAWSKKPIAPGKSGTIGVVYTPDEAGPFMKQINLTCNASTTPVVLQIKGLVARPSSTYKYKIGGLSLKSDTINLGVIPRGNTRSLNLRVKNTGSSPITAKALDLPIYARLSLKPVTLVPDAEGTLSLQLDTHYCPKDVGDSQDFRLQVSANGKTTEQPLHLRFTLHEIPGV
jgi:hypothetical protein